MKKEIETDEVKNEKRNYFGYFLLFFPTLILAAIPSEIGNSIWLPFTLKLMLVFYQFIVVKNFVDKYYGD
jgi:hypothetical protein